MKLTELIQALKCHNTEKVVAVGFETFWDPNCADGVSVRRTQRVSVGAMLECAERALSAYPGSTTVFRQHDRIRRRFDEFTSPELDAMLGAVDEQRSTAPVYLMREEQFENLRSIEVLLHDDGMRLTQHTRRALANSIVKLRSELQHQTV